MVKEIKYSEYKKFCEKLPCKDIFYYIDNLFVCYGGSKEKIFCIKVKRNKYAENFKALNRYYYGLEKKGVINEVDFKHFLLSLGMQVDGKFRINQDFQNTPKSFLVVLWYV